MKKNGFIATSILYSFFLVFLTLFLALVANYLHNQNLVRLVNDECRDKLTQINNTELEDLKPGDYIKFNTVEHKITPAIENQLNTFGITDTEEFKTPLLNRDALWVYAFENEEEENKYLYFLSSSNMIDESATISYDDGTMIYAQRPKDINEKIVGSDSNSLRYILGYNILLKNLEYMSNHYDGDNTMSLLNFDVLKLLMNKAENDEMYSPLVMKNILYDLVNEQEIIISDNNPNKTSVFLNDTTKYSYYKIKINNISRDSSNDEIEELCGLEKNYLTEENVESKIKAANVFTDSEFRYIGTNAKQSSGIIGASYNSYIDYCMYSNFDSGFDVTNSSNTQFGKIMYLKIKVKDENQKVYAGSGSRNKPYLFTDGK